MDFEIVMGRVRDRNVCVCTVFISKPAFNNETLWRVLIPNFLTEKHYVLFKMNSLA